MPERIQLKRTKGWRMPTNTVKVDRSGPFGNPFPVTPGKIWGTENGKRIEGERRYWANGICGGSLPFATREEAAAKSIQMFREWVQQPQQRKFRDLVVVGLRGKNLACWCPIGSPCHADVLLELASEQVDE